VKRSLLALRGPRRSLLDSRRYLRSFARPGIPVLHATHRPGCRRCRCFFQGAHERVQNTRLRSPPTVLRRATASRFAAELSRVYRVGLRLQLARRDCSPDKRKALRGRNRRVLLDAKPSGLVRHSSLPKPAVQLPWQLVLDEEPLDVRNESCPDPVYDPEAILASSIPAVRRAGRRASW